MAALPPSREQAIENIARAMADATGNDLTKLSPAVRKTVLRMAEAGYEAVRDGEEEDE